MDPRLSRDSGGAPSERTAVHAVWSHAFGGGARRTQATRRFVPHATRALALRSRAATPLI